MYVCEAEREVKRERERERERDEEEKEEEEESREACCGALCYIKETGDTSVASPCVEEYVALATYMDEFFFGVHSSVNLGMLA